MNPLRTALGELAGLFVEDRWFALAIAGWLIVVGALSYVHAIPPTAGGIALFCGLAGVLIAGVVRGSSAR